MRRLSVRHIFQITDFCLSVARTSICNSTVRWGDSGRSSMQWPIMDPLQLPHNLYFSGQFHTFVTLCIISACHIMIGTTVPYLPACLSVSVRFSVHPTIHKTDVCNSVANVPLQLAILTVTDTSDCKGNQCRYVVVETYLHTLRSVFQP
jgi:hypothetical protein